MTYDIYEAKQERAIEILEWCLKHSKKEIQIRLEKEYEEYIK